MTTAERKVEFIREQLAEGRTVALTTYCRSTQFDWDKWVAFTNKAGHGIVKLSDDRNTLLMWEGGRFVDANGARLSAIA